MKYIRELNNSLYKRHYTSNWSRVVVDGNVTVVQNLKNPPAELIVIPDIHEEYDRLMEILRKIPFTKKIVFLGDYFDSDNKKHKRNIINMCEFIRERLGKREFIFLLGNHDVQYLSDNDAYKCASYRKKTQKLIDKHLIPYIDLKDFKLVHHESRGKLDWLFSHAGVCREHIIYDYRFRDIEPIGTYLSKLTKFINNSFPEKNTNWKYINKYLAAGKARGGKHTVPGVTWCDWNKEFAPHPSVYQVMGHTRKTGMGKRIKSKTQYSLNYNIDDGLKSVMVFLKYIEYVSEV